MSDRQRPTSVAASDTLHFDGDLVSDARPAPATSTSAVELVSNANASVEARQLERFSLTPRQTLMWMDRKLYPDVPLHQIGLGLRLRGALDLDRLRAALRTVWASTDCLHLRMDEQQPQQWFAPGDVVLEPVDLSASPEQERAWRAALTCQRFEFGQPLVRVGLARLSLHEHLLLIVFHHVLADGATALMVANRLAAAYAGKTVVMPPSYRHYLQHHASYRASKAATDDAAYWISKLGGGTPPLEFYGRPHSDPGFSVATLPVADAQTRLDRMSDLAKDQRIALVSAGLSELIAHVTLLAAYTHRATSNKEIVVAAPYANRPAALENVAGLTMEQLFIKVDVDDDETFLSLAHKVRQEVVSTLRHGRHCVSERGISFVLLNLLSGNLQPFGDLTVEFDPQDAFLFEQHVEGLDCSPRNLLGVNLYEVGGQAPRYEMTFHAATFPPSLRMRARNHFQRLMDAMGENLDAPIAKVPLIDDEERQVLLGLGQGARPAEPPQDLIGRFSNWVERQPTATAVATAGGDISYRQLQRRVRALSAALVGLRIGPEQTVCVSLPRSLDELVALLAVLEVGAAYVPVDPSHPIERTRLVLEDAHPSALLTLSTLAPRFPQIPAIALDKFAWEASTVTPLHEAPAPRPEHLAYVLFTSGSTGRPKGVEVCRGNLANFLSSMAHTPGLGRRDRVLAITTTTFDIAGLELFLPLYVGGVVELVDREAAADPSLLRRVLERENRRITLLQATPATWRMLLDSGFVPEPPLRLLCGGEALSAELAQKLTARGSELWNMYGPTETTVWSSLERVTPGGQRICVGKPIDRTNLYVMGAGLQLVPIGAVGEICIGGAGVARGYHGRPDLTTERFLPDPFAGPHERLYRTGDLGRWLEDGRLECLGRLDHQVKIRGFRIELGEIETCLRAVDGVSEVLVVARPAPSGEARLVAYWTGAETKTAPLAERARAHLPAYMHPTAYVHLAAFPLNTNGKIDRKQLPEPNEGGPDSVALKPPSNETEQQLLALWRTLLHKEAIGVDQSFFNLGGDSVLVVSLAAKIAEDLGVEMPLSLILEEPTIERLARALSPGCSDGRSKESALIELKKGRGKNFFFIHDGDGETLPYRTLALQFPQNVTVYGIMPRPRGALHLPHPTLADLARDYLDEIKRKQPRGPYRLGGLCAGGVIAFEMARQLESAGEKVEPLVLLDAAAPDAPLRFALETRRRARRLRDLLSHALAGEAGAMAAHVAGILRHTQNAIEYELQAFAEQSLVVLRRYLMKTTVHKGRDWPRWLSPPSVRERCLELQRGHDSGGLRSSSVLLVRASHGDGGQADQPLREQYDDPLLGWGGRVHGGFEVLDVPWGHSSMLQSEGAQYIAARLAALL